VYGVVYQQCGDIGGPCPGKPAQGAPVTASGSGGATATTSTDADGFYQLTVSGVVKLCVGVNPQCLDGVAIHGATRWDYIDLGAESMGTSWRQLVCP
jgi:hypothetical protein